MSSLCFERVHHGVSSKILASTVHSDLDGLYRWELNMGSRQCCRQVQDRRGSTNLLSCSVLTLYADDNMRLGEGAPSCSWTSCTEQGREGRQTALPSVPCSRS